MLKISITVVGALAIVLIGLAIYTQIAASQIESRFRATGKFADVGGYKLHFFEVAVEGETDLPPLVFVHGASGNLEDQRGAFEQAFKGRARLIFVDRPGHGYSERGGEINSSPEGQANAIAALLDHLNIEKAIMVGHSFGGSTIAAVAVFHPKKVAGLAFLAPATHPWPGGVSWHNHVAATPIIGPIFCHTLSLPAGKVLVPGAVAGVFKPNSPPEGYEETAATELVLRPSNFCSNATDVVSLRPHLVTMSPRYKEIAAPTVIVTGDSDDVVFAHIHSKGLERDIPGAKLIELKGVGHKPDYVATETIKTAIVGLVSGKSVAEASQ
ncbi:MAG: alpha/beta hydrolase [Pseudomonadota bacterium]